MIKKWIYIVGAILLLSFALYYSLLSLSKDEETSFSKSTKVTIGKVQKSITLIGQIEASKIMAVNSSITGKIIEKYYSLGDSVKAGETLLTIKPDQEKYVEFLRNKNAFYKAKIEFKEKEIEYNNSKELFESHFIHEDELRKSKNAFDIAKMQVEISEKTFEIYKSKYNIDEKSVFKIIPIKAPIGGIVTEDNVEEGNYIKSALSEYNEGTVICVIGNFDELRADFTIAEEYLPVLRKIEKVKLKTKKGANLGVGRIVKISPLGNSNNGYVSFDFSVELKSPPKRIYPGTSVQAEIIITEKDSCLIVPIPAIGFEGEQAFVNFKNDKKIIIKYVKIGVVGNRFVEITEGVVKGDILVY
ncbi:MAG: efflux RND transporter periplasmic adaptor subunit [Bacteroidetes bacterium]|nr:efflux RND transporter periplasmic adaptor subunit [Bacteroidota bacterium]MBU1798756.1 efflux RND transporter periplasmic adaptor subunit [Bacteroidota bacterium]